MKLNVVYIADTFRFDYLEKKFPAVLRQAQDGEQSRTIKTDGGVTLLNMICSADAVHRGNLKVRIYAPD